MRRWSFIRPQPRFWLIVVEAFFLSVVLHTVFIFSFRYRTPESLDRTIETGVNPLNISTKEWQQLKLLDPAGVLHSSGRNGYLSILASKKSVPHVPKSEIKQDMTFLLPQVTPFQNLPTCKFEVIKALPFQLLSKQNSPFTLLPWAVDLKGNRRDLPELKDFVNKNIKRSTLIRIDRNYSLSIWASCGDLEADKKAVLVVGQKKFDPDNLIMINWHYLGNK